MRQTPFLVVDEELALEPAEPSHYQGLAEAFEESWPEVLQALPWYEVDQEMKHQLIDYLTDFNRMGKIGQAHHWAIVSRGDSRLLGLLAFDRITRTRKGHWNLGYWVRDGAMRRGIAKRTSDRGIEWISTTQGGPTAVEITVDPSNEAGLATCMSLVRDWGGIRAPEGDGEVFIGGSMRKHETYLLPRLPLMAKVSGDTGTVWLSLDTDDICHLPKNSGHPKRSKEPVRQEGYVMSEELNAAWESFISWRQGSGRDIPVTLFVIAEQLRDERFASMLKTLLANDETITVGCHGNTHRCWSAWPPDPENFRLETSAAMVLLANFCGDAFRPWYRAPAGYVADWMAEPLAKVGVILDSSINGASLMSRKSATSGGWPSVKQAMMNMGIVEREWKAMANLPVTGPALRLPLIGILSRRIWRSCTRDTNCVSEKRLLDDEVQVDTLYWHLLDHSRKRGKWTPPLHPNLARAHAKHSYKM